jgi:trimethylamine monooxygenase
MENLIEATDYPTIDTEHMTKQFFAWKGNKDANILTFRDQQHTSAWTGVTGAKLKTKWVDEYDTSDKTF